MSKAVTKEQLADCLERIGDYFVQTNEDFTGATSLAGGAKGMVPAPSVGDKDKFLKGDGTWAEAEDALPAMTAEELNTGTSTQAKIVAAKIIADYVSAAVAAIVNSAPATLDTLNELAAALGNDPSFATTIATEIGNKLDANAKAVSAGNADKVNNHTVLSDVPANAKFTDTTYSDFVGSGSTAAAGLVPAPSTTAGTTKYLREDGTWQVPPDNNTTYTAASTAPLANGTAAVGTSAKYAREDHVHPLQTSVSGSSGSCTGNAATASKATQLTTARTIDGVSFNGTGDITHYSSCSTAAATAEKTVDCPGFALATGARITVKFTVTNTAANPTLNVNNTGAKAIYYHGGAIPASYIGAKRTYEVVYNGTEYELIGDVDTNSATNQAISTANNTYPILLGYTANATANIGNRGTLFGSGVKVNPSTSTVVATKFQGTATSIPTTSGQGNIWIE